MIRLSSCCPTLAPLTLIVLGGKKGRFFFSRENTTRGPAGGKTSSDGDGIESREREATERIQRAVPDVMW